MRAVFVTTCDDCPLEIAEYGVCGHPDAPKEYDKENGGNIGCSHDSVPERCPLRTSMLAIELRVPPQRKP